MLRLSHTTGIKLLTVLSAFILVLFSTDAQDFEEVDLGLPALSFSSIVVGDINQDGKLDFGITGAGTMIMMVIWIW